MRKRSGKDWRYAALLVLPVAHLCLCACAPLLLSGWGLIIVYWVDIPISDLVSEIGGGLITLILAGTLWWFFLGLCLFWIWNAIFRRKKPHPVIIQPK